MYKQHLRAKVADPDPGVFRESDPYQVFLDNRTRNIFFFYIQILDNSTRISHPTLIYPNNIAFTLTFISKERWGELYWVEIRSYPNPGCFWTVGSGFVFSWRPDPVYLRSNLDPGQIHPDSQPAANSIASFFLFELMLFLCKN